MKRRNLERSTEQLHANLETLQKLNEEQEKKISSSLYEIQQEQLETKELLSREIIDQAGRWKKFNEEVACSNDHHLSVSATNVRFKSALKDV